MQWNSYDSFWFDKDYSPHLTWNRLVSKTDDILRCTVTGFLRPVPEERRPQSDSAELSSTSREGAML